MKHFILLFTLLFSFNSINAFDPSKLGEDLLKSIPGNVGDQLKNSIPENDVQKKQNKKVIPSNQNLKAPANLDIQRIKNMKCDNGEINGVKILSRNEIKEKIHNKVLKQNIDQKAVYLFKNIEKNSEEYGFFNGKINSNNLSSEKNAGVKLYFKDLDKCISSDYYHMTGYGILQIWFEKGNKLYLNSKLNFTSGKDTIVPKNFETEPEIHLFESSKKWADNITNGYNWIIADSNSKGLKTYYVKTENESAKKSLKKLADMNVIEKEGQPYLNSIYQNVHYVQKCVNNGSLPEFDPAYLDIKKKIKNMINDVLTTYQIPEKYHDKVKDISYEIAYNKIKDEMTFQQWDSSTAMFKDTADGLVMCRDFIDKIKPALNLVNIALAEDRKTLAGDTGDTPPKRDF